MTIVKDFNDEILHEFDCNEINEDEIVSYMEREYPYYSEDDYYYIRTKNDF